MTPEQVLLVRASFVKLARLGEQAAVLFYERLFALDPSLRPLFEADLAAQRRKLLSALALVVGGLDRLDQLLPVMRELGRRHAAYGAQPEHYATLGSALLWTLEHGLGSDFTPATRRAWLEAYNLVACIMIVAAETALRERQAA